MKDMSPTRGIQSITPNPGRRPERSPPAASAHPYFHRAGSFDQKDKLLHLGLVDAVIEHRLAHKLRKLKNGPPPRFLVLQSEPGMGKDAMALAACSRNNVHVFMVPASEFSGPGEGDATRRLDAAGATMTAISTEVRGPIAMLVPDFDCSIAFPKDGQVGTTINTGLFISRLQDWADYGEHRDWEGDTIPIIMSVNNAAIARSSLLRPSRARFFTLKIEREEMAHMVGFSTGVGTGDRLQSLIDRYPGRTMAFWHDVREKARAVDVMALWGTHGDDITAIDAALEAQSRPLTIEDLEVAAEAVSVRAENFLEQR